MRTDKPSVDGLMALLREIEIPSADMVALAGTPAFYDARARRDEGRKAIRAYASRLAQPQGEPAEKAHIQNLTLLGNGMASQLKKAKPECTLPGKWGEYVHRNGLSSPLRADTAPPPQSADQQDFDRRLALQKASYEREIAIEAAADRELLQQALAAMETAKGFVEMAL
jgi:hypothetical protein